MDSSSSIMLVVIGLVVGFTAGMGCYRLFSKSQREITAMRQTLLEREHQIAEIKNSVGGHLTGIYQRLSNIRDEADLLEKQLKEDATEWNIRDMSQQHTLNLSGSHEIKEQISIKSLEANSTPAMPRDYADGSSGTLSEDFGLKNTDSSPPQPPRY